MHLTIKDLKKNIRKLTEKMNERIALAYAEGNVPVQIEKIIGRLQKIGSKPSIKNRNRDYIGMGFRGKRKKDLEMQERELNRYLLNDVWTPEGIRAQSEREQHAYESFLNNQKVDWDYEKWRDFVYFMDNASNEVLNAFSYEKSNTHRGSKSVSGNKFDLVGTFDEAHDKNVNLARLMEDVYNELPEGSSQEEAIEMLKERIKGNIT